MNWDSKLHHTFMRSSVSTRGYHRLPIGRRTWEIGTHTDKADSADILWGTLQNERRKNEGQACFWLSQGKNMREKMQYTARTDAVQCKGGCSALRERLQCTASEMGKTGTETFSPILDKRIGRRDSPHTGHCSPPGYFC